MKMNSKAPFILYGGDYNPDQWDDEIIEKDMEYFRKAGVNLVTLPVFSWAKLEPEEGRYEFEWLDKIMGTLLKNHINVFLSTPTVLTGMALKKISGSIADRYFGKEENAWDEGVLLCE